MPTRRVAVAGAHLPHVGAGWGSVLLGAVAGEFMPMLSEEQRLQFPQLLAAIENDDFSVPSIAMRYRLQLDQHGLDRSLHRIVEEPVPGVEHLGADTPTYRVLQLDMHGASDPQVIGCAMAAALLSGAARRDALRALKVAYDAPGVLPRDLVIRRLVDGLPTERAPLAGSTAATDGDARWSGVPAEHRWAMEVLGIRSDMTVDRVVVQERFRRLLRLAHPDQGAAARGAAERIAELREAREVLLTALGSVR
jgi:hypothetical protein